MPCRPFINTLAILALSNFPNTIPVPFANTCVNDGLLQAIQQNEPEAQLFCRDYTAWGTLEVTSTMTIISTVGSTTETQMVTSTPTVDITVAADYMVQLTTTMACSSTADAQPTDDASPADAAPAHAAAEPVHAAPAHAEPAAPAKAEPAHVAHEGRHAALPGYVASFQPKEISSACNCLSQSVGAVTTTTTAVMTVPVPTVTKAYTTVNNSPIMRYHNVDATRTMVQTACMPAATTAA